MKPSEFYDVLAPDYELIYENWEAGIDRQAKAIDSIIRSAGHLAPCSVLDVACGIGTQSLGLAARGYDVTSSDVSAAAIERARIEAKRRNLNIQFSVGDMRAAFTHHVRQFDVVLCADNSLPHLLSDEEILTALTQFYQCTVPGGLCIISVRDYETFPRGSSQLVPHGVRYKNNKRYVVFQVWQWRDALYDFDFYIVEDDGTGNCHTRVLRSTYYAISIAQISALLARAGFVDIHRIDNVYFQPVIVAIRSAM